ncbi:MAG: nucleotidyltransferase domain-containing protein [Chitinivibrionales bacterium]|nr:nucleotidyltransferase domain-containing protein [Chitinivibrionales bacterium]
MNATYKAILSVEEIVRRLRPAFERAGIERAILFGSYARDIQTRHSDIDLLIVLKTEKRYFDRFDDLRPIFDALVGYEVELLVHTPEELERNKDRPFMRTILGEGMVIYGD